MHSAILQNSIIRPLKGLFLSDARTRRASLTILSLTASRGVGVIVRIVSVPLALTLLGTERYGVWLTIGSLLAWFSLGDLGISTGLLNPLSVALAKREIGHARQLVSSAFFFLLAVALILLLLVVGLVIAIPPERVFNVSAPFGSEVQVAFLLQGIFVAMAFPLGIAMIVLRAQQREYVGVNVQIITQFIGLGLLFLMTWTGSSLGAFTLAILGPSFAASVAVAIWLFFKKNSFLRPKLSLLSREAFRIVGSQGIMFFVAYIGGMVIMQTDNLVITYFLGPSLVPTYAVPYQLLFNAFMLIGFWMQSLWPAFTEALAKNDIEWIINTYRRMALLSVGVMAVISVSFGIWGRPLVQIWTRGSVQPPSALLWVMSAYFLLWTWAGVNATLIKALGGVRLVMLGTLASASLNIVATIILVRPLGVVGVTLGSLTASVLVDMWLGPLVVWLKLRKMRLNS